MFGFIKSPFNKQDNVASSATTSPLHSSADPGGLNHARRTSSEPMLITPDLDNDSKGRQNSSTAPSPYNSNTSTEAKNRYKNDFRDTGGFENQSVQELENYGVHKSEETTKTVNSCLRIAEDIREDATKTLETLHQQGEQIHKTHQMAVTMDQDLSKGEKLLNSLGGMFSKPWKPKKTRNIAGPLITPDNSHKAATKEQKENLVGPVPKGRGGSKTPQPEPTNAMQKIEMEKAKQDDGLDDLSNILGDLKGMAVEMGSELERQNKALDHLGNDIDELNSRVKGANQRARKLVGK